MVAGETPNDETSESPLADGLLRAVPNLECEWARRDFTDYRASLFPDEGAQAIGVDELAAAGFTYSGPGMTNEGVAATFAGLDGFFQPGAAILDIGSGSGRAVNEMIAQYAPRGVSITGLDSSYFADAPETAHPEAFVPGSWEKMPLPDNAYSGLLSSESFPTHSWPDTSDEGHEKNEQTVAEITRVAKPGAVWRATVGGFQGLPRQRLRDMLVASGWEVYYFPGLMVARLLSR